METDSHILRSPQISGKFENKPEYLIRELSCASINILVAVVHRRLKAAAPIEFFPVLSPMIPMVKTVIITGDFNANIAAPASPDASTLLNTIRPLGLKVVYDSPTHHAYDSQTHTHLHTSLDLFIVGRDTTVASFSQSPAPFIAGHDFIRSGINLITPKPPPITITTRQLKKIEVTQLNMTLSQAL